MKTIGFTTQYAWQSPTVAAPFSSPMTATSGTHGYDPLAALLTRDDFKAGYEAYVASVYFARNLLKPPREPENPFDAIYIARLTPDPLTRSDVRKIRKLKRIKDLSDGLDFKDDWQD